MSKSKSNPTPFRAQVERDLEQTFFNLLEFGEVHNIDGREMICLFEESDMRDKDGYKGMLPSKHADGIYTDTVKLFVQKSVFGAKPKIGVPLLIDARRNYRVAKATEEAGLYVLTLEAWR